MQPPPLVRRCKATTAGLGYLEEASIVFYKVLTRIEPVSALSCCRIWTLDSLNDNSA